MKNFKKVGFLIYICFLICFCFLTILGIKTRWGSSENTPLKGVNSINWDENLNDMVSINLSFEKKVNQEQKEEIKKILKKRLDLLGFEENEIYLEEGGETVLVNLPASYHKEVFDFSDVANYLSAKGNLKVFKTKENQYDFLMQQAPKKDKKEEFLLDDSGVYSASLIYDDSKKSKMNSSNKIASIKLNLFENEKEKLLNIYKETTKKRKQLFENKKELSKAKKELEKFKENFDENNNEQKKELEKKEKEINDLNGKIKSIEEDITSQNIKILLDQNTVYEGNILNLINDKFEIVGSNFQNNPKKILGFVNIINSQKLPVNLKINKISKNTSSFGSDFLKNLAICSALFLAITLIIIGLKYRLFFVLALFIFGLHFAFFVSIFTGVFPFFPGVCVSFGSILGVFASFLVGIFVFILNVDQIFKGVKSKKNLTLCVEHTFKDNRFLIHLNIIVLIISAVLTGVFAPSIDLFYYIFKPISSLFSINSQSFIFSFSYALFFGSIATLFFELLTTNISLKLLDAFLIYKKNRKPKVKKPKKSKPKKTNLTKKLEAKPNEAKI